MIANGFLRKPKLLIWDEATSNLDEETELELLQTIKTERENMAMLIISHRRSLMDVADKILILDSNKELHCLRKEEANCISFDENKYIHHDFTGLRSHD